MVSALRSLKKVLTALVLIALFLGAPALGLADSHVNGPHNPTVAKQSDSPVIQQVLAATVMVAEPGPHGRLNGTGVLINVDQRRVVTANHVVEGMETVTVYFPQKDENGRVITDPDTYLRNSRRLGIRGRVVARNALTDVAIVEVERVPAGVQAVPLASGPFKSGETVHVLGHSGFKEGKVWGLHSGEILRVRQLKLNDEDHPFTGRVVEYTTFTDHGDSGGPVFNNSGQLLAIVRGYYEVGGKRDTNFGVEVSEIRKVLTTLDQPPADKPSPSVKPSAPSNKPAKPAKPDVQENPMLTGGMWVRTTPSPEGDYFVQQFTEEGEFLVVRLDRDGNVLDRQRGAYTLSGNELTVRLSSGVTKEATITWIGEGRFVLTTPRGDRTEWVRK
jgi:S1-C subfamily serine protease